jgi:hypothetical protein
MHALIRIDLHDTAVKKAVNYSGSAFVLLAGKLLKGDRVFWARTWASKHMEFSDI